MMNEHLLQGILYFTRETRIMDGMAAVCGRDDFRAAACDGREIREKTLFDLASVTKLFTGITLMRLIETGTLDPQRRITDYCPAFSGLRSLTVEQAMGFQRLIQTPERIDEQESRENALAILREARDAGPTGPRAYSDIPAMILRYVIEAAAEMPMYACIKKLILEPADMRETWAGVPEDRKKDCLIYGPEYRIEGEKKIRREAPARGIPHDPKAGLLQGDSGDLCGHAGLFSTLGDMEKLAQALLAERILKKESLKKLAVNRTGRRRPDGSYTQYLGYQCYLKHPDQYYSEIPAAMGPEAFGIGGFTGNHFSVDPQNHRYTIFLGNRVRDRLTVLIPPAGKQRADYGLNADGTGEIIWEDGSRHFSSVDYVHQKDAHFHTAAETALKGSKMRSGDFR